MSDGKFGPDLPSIYENWAGFRSRVAENEAWDHIAGLTIGQDLSERVSQLAGPAPQFSLGKSFPGFAPVGPWLVTPETVPDRDDLGLGCAIDGETVQDGRTRDLIFPVARLVAELSRTITLRPGDLVFTGTPAGVGQGRNPQWFLRPGEEPTSWYVAACTIQDSGVFGLSMVTPTPRPTPRRLSAPMYCETRSRTWA